MAQIRTAAIMAKPNRNIMRSPRLIFPGCIGLKPTPLLLIPQPVVGLEHIRRQPVDVLANRRGERSGVELVRTRTAKRDGAGRIDDGHSPSLATLLHVHRV